MRLAPRAEALAGRALHVALVAAAGVLGACASAGSSGHAQARSVPMTRVRVVTAGTSFSPQSGTAAVRAFVPDVPAFDSAGECSLFKMGGLSKTMILNAAFPTRDEAKMVVALTFDSAGHLVRYSETRGFTGLHHLPPNTSGAQRDTLMRAALEATRTTSVSFDYAIDQAIVRNYGGGAPEQAVLATPREFESLPSLGPVTARLVHVRKLCGM